MKRKKKSSTKKNQRLYSIVLIGGVFLFFVLLFFIHLTVLIPTAEQVKRMFENKYTTVLSYQIWDGVPYMLFRIGDTVHFDRLVLDPFSFSIPPLPRWRWSGVWYSVPATEKKVSVAIGYCTGERMKLPPQCHDLDIFGQINDKHIIAMEIQFVKNGKWQHVQVSYPGFAIRFPDFTGVPVDYRFLDEEGRVVVSKDPLIPLEKPGY